MPEIILPESIVTQAITAELKSADLPNELLVCIGNDQQSQRYIQIGSVDQIGASIAEGRIEPWDNNPAEIIHAIRPNFEHSLHLEASHCVIPDYQIKDAFIGSDEIVVDRFAVSTYPGLRARIMPEGRGVWVPLNSALGSLWRINWTKTSLEPGLGIDPTLDMSKFERR